MSSLEHEGLELVRWRTRFARPESESAYRTWQLAYSVPFNRAGLIVSILFWVTTIPLLVWLAPSGSSPWVAAMLFEVLFIIGPALASTYSPKFLAWMPWLTALANAVAGLIAVSVTALQFRVPEMSIASALIVNFFGFAILRIRPLQAGLAVAPYLLLDGVLFYRDQGWNTASIGAIFALQQAFVAGLVVSIVLDVVSRQTFRQERIIEAQKETIQRERVRSESILKSELGYQVAARSRELGQILQRVEASFVVGRLAPGDRFDGRYLVKRALGAGGMGAVYEVERTTDGLRFALKLITGEVSGAHAARFAREAEIGARVRHPNVVSIVDVGVASGAPFLVMELADGGSLEDVRTNFGDAAWARPILTDIADGIAALHDAGVVHRDLKPANVLFAIEQDHRMAKISDFGISRFGALDLDGSVDPTGPTVNLGVASRAHGLTATGALLGTPFYMAPESARGGKTVDAPADVFAFGILAFEMLTGRAPFGVPPVFVAMAGERLPAPTFDGPVPKDLHEILVACLAEDPASRPSIGRVRNVLGARGAKAP